MPVWVQGIVCTIKNWTDQLFSLVIRAPIYKFIPGQFAKLGIKVNNIIVQRAYSYLNAPDNLDLEFYITTVPYGKCTSLLRALSINDVLLITQRAYGKFILNEIPICKNLWMFATGTGIAPYLSILESFDQNLMNFNTIVLVHAVQFSKNLNYLSNMIKLQCLYKNKLRIQTILSQELSSNSLYGRIPALIENNVLEKEVGLILDSNNSHVMLCGNPNMIRDTKKILNSKYGMIDHAKRKPGHITYERYW